MALVFQYGSNMSVARLNNADRLAGDAKPIGVAKTAEPFELAFSVWSKRNVCAAADIVPSMTGRSVYGVVYDIPDFLLSRDTATKHNRQSLDAIEGEGTNYVRTTIDLLGIDGSRLSAITYVVKDRKTGLKTSLAYVQHILVGLKEHNIPDEYCKYVRSRIIENNSELEQELLAVRNATDETESWNMKSDDETPTAFLARLGTALKTREGVDADLAEVVSEHLLTVSPTKDCVEQALAAITRLASERTSPPKESADG